MSIKLDKSNELVVVYCTECGHWRAAAWTVAEAHNRAVTHEQNVHPDSTQARDSARRYAGRTDAETGNVPVGADDVSHEHSGASRVHA